MSFFRDIKNAFLEGMESERNRLDAEREEPKQRRIKQGEVKQEEEVTICVVSAGDNIDGVVNLLCADWGCDLEDAQAFVENLPNSLEANKTDAVFLEDALKECGANAYIVEPDEMAYLKIISVDNANKENVIRIIEKEIDKGTEGASEFIKKLPKYIMAPIECAEKANRELRAEGAETVILGVSDYEAEVSDGDEQEECELSVIDAGSNKVAVIKIIRDYTNGSLSDAKDFVENLPQPLYASMELLEEIQKELENAGAKAVILGGDKNSRNTEIENTENQDTEKKRFCPACGSRVGLTAKFCTECGEKLF